MQASGALRRLKRFRKLAMSGLLSSGFLELQIEFRSARKINENLESGVLVLTKIEVSKCSLARLKHPFICQQGRQAREYYERTRLWSILVAAIIFGTTTVIGSSHRELFNRYARPWHSNSKIQSRAAEAGLHGLCVCACMSHGVTVRREHPGFNLLVTDADEACEPMISVASKPASGDSIIILGSKPYESDRSTLLFRLRKHKARCSYDHKKII